MISERSDIDVIGQRVTGKHPPLGIFQDLFNHEVLIYFVGCKDSPNEAALLLYHVGYTKRLGDVTS